MAASLSPHASDEETQVKRYDRRLVRRLFVYVRPYKQLVAGALVLLMTEGLLQLVGPILTERVIDVALPARDVAMAWHAALLFAGSLVLAFGCSYGETLLTALLGQRVMRDLRQQLFEHVQGLSIAFYDRTPVGRLVTRVTSDVESLNELFTAGVVAGLGDVFTLLQLQRVHEAVLGRTLNKDSFRRRMIDSGLLKATGRSQSGVGHRPAELYRFARRI